MRITVKRYKVYGILTFVALGISAVAFLWISWWFLFLMLAIAAQYEFVNFHVAVILRQYVMFRQKKVSELNFTKFQLQLKKLFGI